MDWLFQGYSTYEIEMLTLVKNRRAAYCGGHAKYGW
jgi:hypothetical protein